MKSLNVLTIFVMRAAFLPALILCLTLLANGQAPVVASSSRNLSNADSAAEVLSHARKLYFEEGARVALPEFEKALALFRRQKDGKGEAITLGLIGNCYKKLGEYPKALDYLQRALTMKRDLGDRTEEGKTLSNLGLVYWEMGQYPAAIEHFNKAIAIGNQLGDRRLEGAARNNLGLVYDELGDYRRSLAEYNHTLELYRGTDFEAGISDAIANIGGTHLLLGEFSKALEYYQQAFEIDERNKLKSGLALDLQNIGLCYTGMGRLTEALESFDRSIKMATEAGLKKELTDSRKGKASALVQLGRYTAALSEFNALLSDYESAGMKPSLIEGLGDLGNLELRLGDVASAERDFRRALELSRGINQTRGVTVNLIALGDLEWRRKRFKEAAIQYGEALARANESKDQGSAANAHIQLAHTLRELGQLAEAKTEADLALEIARNTQARLLETEALYALAETARAAKLYDEALKRFDSGRELVLTTGSPEMSWRLDFGRGQTLEKLGRDEDALTAYQNAVKTIEQVRSELREDRFRAGYIEDKYQVYVTLVELLLKLKRISEAFSFAERLRARSYLELVNRGQSPTRSESQRQTEAALRARIRKLQEQVEAESSKAAPEQRRQSVAVFSSELREAESDYQKFLSDMLPSDSAYAAVLSMKVPTTGEVQQLLPRGTALVEYVLADDNLLTFVLTANGLQATAVPVRATDVKSKVTLLRDRMLHKETNEWQLPAAALYQILIAPIETAGWLKGVNRIYLIPHADLHYVPFAALIRQPGNRSRPLMEDYTLAYLPAASTLVYREDPKGAAKSVFALAPANTRLLYARQESQDVSGFFPQHRKVLVGVQATESSFKRFADRYDVIHLATHGYFNKLNPLLSGFMLEPDATEDGRMEVHEILGLKLNAKLVTLSACDTALGTGYFADIPAGDDLVGLTRAFLFAGAPSVLASLWEVNDRSAGVLMHSFYGHLGRADKATALAEAQRGLRARRGPYAHPYYWGSFVLVGQMN
jgi:CHAT domain-containing protein/Tfp pilus assembly protein PilF